MRKKVDRVVRGLVESCVASRERGLFVLVGDRGREQVVNLYYLLSSVGPHRPAVLWCYKKELGFSSHRRKRQRLLRKKISRGLYDPNVEDPFELFVSSAQIRYVHYADSQQVLGCTFGLCVLQDFEGLSANLLCRAVETVAGGGLVLLLLQQLQQLQQLYRLAFDFQARYKAHNLSQLNPRFSQRFLLSLVDCRRCLILDDELNVLPINGAPGVGAPDPLLLQQQQQQQQQLQLIKDKVQHAPPLDALVKLCATKDQANAVLAFLDCLCSCKSFRGRSHTSGGPQQGPQGGPQEGPQGGPHGGTQGGEGYQTVALTAGRGRGKSAALGLAVAAAVSLGVSSIFICAPQAENVQTLFEFVQKGLKAMGLREQGDFQVTLETVGTGGRGPKGADLSGAAASGLYQQQSVKAVTRIEVYRHHRQRVQFIFPHEQQSLINADLLVVDEAASIPLPVIKRLLGPYIVLLSSTVNGYEGTGRSLSLKLLADLRRGLRGPPGSHGVRTPQRQLKELSLEVPIRYAAGDAIEQWLHSLLCLDSTTAPALDPAKGLPAASSCALYLVNRDALFSYHPASEAFLQRLQGLFVSSHYKNSPNDLQLMADAPAHLLFVFLKTVEDQQDTLPDIYCAIQVAIEGSLSRGAIREALGRGLRPAGDLLPWTLAQAFGNEDVGLLTGARIVRIAVHPSLQRMGFGSAALQQLIDFFEGKGLSLQEPQEFAAFAQRKAAQQQQQQPQQGSKRKEKVSKMDADIEDLDLEAGTSDEETESEEPDEAAAEEEKGPKGTKERAKNPKNGKRDKDKAADSLSILTVTPEQLRPQTTPPLLCPCARSCPPFAVDYLGTAFGLTDQLLRFWARRGFVPVYLRQQPNDVTGEHSCIMLRPAAPAPAAAAAAAASSDAHQGETHKRGLYGGIDEAEARSKAADGHWVQLFAADFRRRFVELTGGPFRDMSVSLALATLAGSRGQEAEGYLPAVNAETMFQFLTRHDLSRLHKYAQQLADLALITDLVPLLCALYFGQRLRPLQLSFLQEAALLGMGGQRRQPDTLAEEFKVPVHQILALFNKAIVKIHQHLHNLLEAEEESAFAARRVAVKQGEAVGGAEPQGPLAEEQQKDAAKVLQQQSIQLQQIKEALGPDALEKYGVSHITPEDIEDAAKGREVSGSISIRKKAKAPGDTAASGEGSSAAKTKRNKKFRNLGF